jgi:hypothetical protein
MNTNHEHIDMPTTTNIQIISNGGEPLGDCPTSWDQANQWESQANTNSYKLHEPTWKWDCGFKLDYDGPVVSFSSRFYPPKTHYGPKWGGTVTVLILGEEMQEKPFESDSLEELRSQVETFKTDVVDKLRGAFIALGLEQQQTTTTEAP